MAAIAIFVAVLIALAVFANRNRKPFEGGAAGGRDVPNDQNHK